MQPPNSQEYHREKLSANNQDSRDAEQERRYVEAIRQARLHGLHSFQSWFNQSSDIAQALTRGYWDFSVHILTPKVCEHIREPEQKTALEIGYGGGRLLNAACSYFGQAIGIDIHHEEAFVESFLRSQGKSNFRLIRTSGRSIDVESDFVDFIYSFIVMQHLPSFDSFVAYLKESYRTLRRGGVAQLYFGKYSKLNVRERVRHFIHGYREIPEAPVNETSLVIRLSKAVGLCRDLGFRVVDAGTSYKDVPDGHRRVTGGQSYVTLLK